MGVYIKNMKIPTNCDECPFMMLEDTNCVPELFCGCILTFHAHPQGVGHRPEWCPLTEIPLHSNLIEQDSIGLTDFEIIMCNGDYKEGMKMLLQKISNAPIIIPKEESNE